MKICSLFIIILQTFDRCRRPDPIQAVREPTESRQEISAVMSPQSQEKEGREHKLVVLVVRGPEAQPQRHYVHECRQWLITAKVPSGAGLQMEGFNNTFVQHDLASRK